VAGYRNHIGRGQTARWLQLNLNRLHSQCPVL